MLVSNGSTALDKPNCFVAYPSKPEDRAESIEKAIEEFNTGGVVDVLGWKSLTVAGRVVVSAICDEIKTRHVFIADVTGLNPNVMFELGYAIGRKKRIWLLLNRDIEHAKKEFDRFQLLTTIGYQTYSNSSDITGKFYRDEPYKQVGHRLYDELLKEAGPPSKQDTLLYLRCDVNTEASMHLARRVSNVPVRSIIDDPQEVRRQPLSWYVQQVTASFGVVCHLLSNEHLGWELNNARHALVAGLAHGMGKPLLILAHEPYVSPLDYRDLLRPHRTAARAVSMFDDWFLPHLEQYEKRLGQASAYRVSERAQKRLRDISIGEPVAEFESESVREYYVPTSSYTETLNSRYSIVVGRKGTGKTATIYALTEELSSDPRNHICVIKPVGYELEGLINVLRHELSRAEKGYLVESFWKFLLYTELAKSVYDSLASKPSFYTRTTAESNLYKFVEDNQSLITPDFSTRLERAVERLLGLQTASAGEGRRLRISELLHDDMLPRLRALLGKVLEIKPKVAMLIDNLDKAWHPKVDLLLLSELLFGLLNVGRKVADEFGRDASNRIPVNLFFALFLRSDIYAAMLHFAQERDKLPARRIMWDDPDLLRRVVEERLMKSDSEIGSPAEGWEKYFVPKVHGIQTWQYISLRILPRPRDLIFLIKSALQLAVNRGRTLVEEKDVLDGEKLYSRFALDSLIVEAEVRLPTVEDFLLHFVQSSEVLNETDIRDRLVASGIPVDELPAVINLFGELTFIGFEVSPNRFDFMYDEQDARKILAMADRTASTISNGVRRFRIHPAFQAYLEITSHSSTIPGQMTIDLSPEQLG